MARNQRLDATITIGSVLQKSVGKNLNIIRGGLDKVGDEIKQVTDRQRELSKQRKVLERQGRSVEDLDREYEDLGRTLDNLRRKQERFERAQAAANRVGREFGRTTQQVGRFARTASIAIGATSGAVFGLASSTASLGDEVAKQSKALGINAGAYQELRYAAERSGVPVETFNSSMVAFTKRLGEAAQGTGAAKDALDQMGLSAQDLISMEPDAAMGAIAERFREIKTPAERAAAAADLFSRQGVRMSNLLGEGREGIAALREEGRDIGFVLDETALADAETFQDRLLDTKLTIMGLKNTIGAELMPAVSEVMADFGKFMRENRDDVERFAKKFAEGVRETLPKVQELTRGIVKMGSWIGRAVGEVKDLVGGWENFGIVLGGVLAAKTFWRIGALAFSVGKLGVAVLGLTGMTALAKGGFKSLAKLIGAQMAAAAAATEAAAGRMSRAFAFGGLLGKFLRGVPVVAGVTMGLGIKPTADGTLDNPDQAPADPEDLSRQARERQERDDEPPTLLERWGLMRGPTQERAVGGSFSAMRPLLVGERGPELMFPSQSGYIAHNRALARMSSIVNELGEALFGTRDRDDGASLEAKRRDLGPRPVPRRAAPTPARVFERLNMVIPHSGNADGRDLPQVLRVAIGSQMARSDDSQRMRGRQEEVTFDRLEHFDNPDRNQPREASLSSRHVTQHITINAQGMSVEQLVDEIERRKRQAQNDALYDVAPGYGQYEGAF